ncbi:MAG: glycosyltransferase [Bacteroidetes bacterium]|uniref:glycosyltransferase n=1 Tax=Phnomibacter sp. TaxID=2836217 RepID=UPI002FDDB917|nr:glycosyltransferase [Bacteroidota bacterium]
MAAQLILISDGKPSINGAGISQTLANLLDAYPGKITCVCADTEQRSPMPGELLMTIAYYSTGPWRCWSNRLGHWVNPYLLRKQLQWMMQQPLDTTDLPAPTAATVLVSTTVAHKLLYAWRLLKAGYTVLPYFMDDWMANDTRQWNHRRQWYNIHLITKELLQHAPAWLMISRQLANTLRHRYNLLPKPTLIIHNPAPSIEFAANNLQLARSTVAEDDLSCKLQTANCKLQTTNRKLVYAGSIWPMHADALIAVAKAIHLLQAQGQTAYELTIYTSEAHWAQYRLQLTGPGVQYGGWKPYHEIHAPLQQAWLLVCTASFAEAHQAYSRSSVQTKLTDYMACGKPILFVGPADAASGAFVEDYDLGFTLATQVPADIAERLQVIARMPEQDHRKQLNTLHEARTRFSKALVQQELYAFLKKISSRL